jgi:hypothetical protein
MAHGRNKYQSRESRARVREILMREWDPIGVAGVPEAADEYDTYVGTVYVMLMDQRASEQQLASYLYNIAADYIGITATPDLAKRCDNTAAVLISVRPEFETH